MTNNSIQVFKGGWEELQNGIITDNQSLISSSPKSEFIKPDGTAIFVTSGGIVEKYLMSIPWDVNTIGSIVDSFTITDDSDPHGIAFKPDGTKMIIVGINTSILYEYTLVIPWEPSSIVASPVTLSLSFTALECTFSRDGDFVFVTSDSDVHSFPLPTPYDITSNVSTTFFAPVLSGDVDGLAFKPEGDKMYLIDDLTNIVIEYDLSPVYDITSAIPSGNTLVFSTIEPASIFFRSNGLETFILDFQNSEIFRFHLDESWDISTASLFTNTFPVPGVTFPVSITWKPDGTTYFILDSETNDRIKQFSVPVPYNTNGSTLIATFVVTSIEANPRGMFFHLDGTRLWIFGTSNKRIHQINMSTPWDLSTATDPSIFSNVVSSTNPQGFTFLNNGSTVFFTDATDNVMSIPLTTPYDVTTIGGETFTLDIIANSEDPRDVVVKPGDKFMYIISQLFNTVARYVLSTPGDLSTATFVDSLNVSATAIQGLYIRLSDGKKLYALDGAGTLDIFTFDMTLEFNNTIITNFGDELITNAGEVLVHA